MNIINKSPLSKKINCYNVAYNPKLLFAIPRLNNTKIFCDTSKKILFRGFDIWTAYEFSWLNLKGKPKIAILQIIVPANSPNIIESKSLKLYLNSFNQNKIENNIDKILIQDISKAIGSEIQLNFIEPHQFHKIHKIQKLKGICLDDLDIQTNTYIPDEKILKNIDSNHIITEHLVSNLLKSNCPVTNQPDWASIQISYTGKPIDHYSLLKYLISFRNHNDFHEHCIERIFFDIKSICNPKKLTIYGRYTRRGGIDINPWRTDSKKFPNSILRVIRQ
ncbi:NADPH-dependent 7-cyano-7-deazaguanine reductase [Candidatus Kinetoplastibacterium sorsogonicusi]|uniref:NADPH-dependent 7-cyano-7-deazaguanine reductase n=1 Tax=Candidatus Kinetoplastidibacterium kentomonadis TaxID=1576550 RepID=A0A3S7J9G9_9PROT|nr:NADPH-dependent 7-cyano-7-deazaguanine reductase QueF [Candidatus Kinetoplastibacterium sorsogonicusi]AWD32311.1 NADPH-dependent 7-cyano-7-deazaguanine reductase [Candidatus Kinetoplastibacterium sorsogonicusi]